MSEGGDSVAPGASELVFYQGEDGKSRIQVRLDGGTVWLTQRLLAELFQVSVPTVNEHLANIFEEGELGPDGNHSEIPNSSNRGGAAGHPAHRPLQPGGHPGRRLPGPVRARHAVPSLGHGAAP